VERQNVRGDTAVRRAEHTKDRESRIIPISSRLKKVLEMRRNRPASAPFLRSACVLGDEQTSTYLNATLRGLHESMRNLDLSRPACKQPRPRTPACSQASSRQKREFLLSLTVVVGGVDGTSKNPKSQFPNPKIARQVRSLGRQNGVGLLLQHELRIQVAAIGEVTALLEDDIEKRHVSLFATRTTSSALKVLGTLVGVTVNPPMDCTRLVMSVGIVKSE
jgi:hypothetical protein